jgi:acetolactate decarboxylase
MFIMYVPKLIERGVTFMKSKCIICIVVILVLNISLAFSQDQVLFSDSFSGKDGIRPQKWSVVNAPEKNYWYLHDGQFTTGNGDDLISGNGYSFAFVNIDESDSWTDYSVESSFWISQTNGKVILIARWEDEDNHYQGVLETYQDKKTLEIKKVFKGVATTLVSIKDGVNGAQIPSMQNGKSKSDARTIKLTVSGNKLTLSLQGVAPIEAEDKTFRSGTAGVGNWFQFIYYDDFVVNKCQKNVKPETITSKKYITSDMSETLTQVSTINSLMAANYDGCFSFKDIEKFGDFGLGTFHSLDGEMVALDGEYYQVRIDGTVHKVKGDMTTPFVAITYFDTDEKFKTDGIDFKELKSTLDGKIKKDLFYAIRVDGIFDYVKTRSVTDKKPYHSLVEVVKNQAIFEAKDIRGTLVGIYCPEFVKGINVPGYHFHFLSEDKKFGGHVLNVRIKKAETKLDETTSFQMLLPENFSAGGSKEGDVEKVEKDPEKK